MAESKIDDAVKLCLLGPGDKLFPVLVDVVQGWKDQFKNLADEDEKAFLKAMCLALTAKCTELYNAEPDETEDGDDDASEDEGDEDEDEDDANENDQVDG